MKNSVKMATYSQADAGACPVRAAQTMTATARKTQTNSSTTLMRTSSQSCAAAASVDETASAMPNAPTMR